MPTSTTRCRAISVAAGPMCAFVKQSSRLRRVEREAPMVINHHGSGTIGLYEGPCADDLSRRGFLRAGAAAGGGLILSLSLPFGNSAAEAADAFAPNAFIRIGSD